MGNRLLLAVSIFYWGVLVVGALSSSSSPLNTHLVPTPTRRDKASHPTKSQLSIIRGGGGSGLGSGLRGGGGGQDSPFDNRDAAQARFGYDSDRRGVDLDLDLNINKLFPALGRVSGPMAVIVRLAQQSIFYGAPVLAVGHFFRNSWLRKRMQTASPNSDQYDGDLKLLDETVQPRSLPPTVIYKNVIDFPALGKLFSRALGQFLILVVTTHLVGCLINSQATCGAALENKILRGMADAALCFTVVFFGSRLGGLLRFRMDMDWYRRVLRKPKWTPPPPAFPIIWTPLFIMQVIAYFYVWRAVDRKAISPPLLLFLAHKTLGDLWNLTFFGQKRVGAGLSVMYMFYGTLAASCYAFFSVVPKASYLLFPTAIWVFVATALNYSVWLLNGREPRYPYTEVIQYV